MRERHGGKRNELRIREKTRREAERATNLGKDPAGSVTSYESGKRPGGKRRCGPILVLRYGVKTITG
jgi:hypothetical protein